MRLSEVRRIPPCPFCTCHGHTPREPWPANSTRAKIPRRHHDDQNAVGAVSCARRRVTAQYYASVEQYEWSLASRPAIVQTSIETMPYPIYGSKSEECHPGLLTRCGCGAAMGNTLRRRIGGQHSSSETGMLFQTTMSSGRTVGLARSTFSCLPGLERMQWVE